MRRWLPTLGALAVLTGLAAFLLWGPEPGSDAGTTEPRTLTLIQLSRDEVTQLKVQGDGFTLDLGRETRAIGQAGATQTIWLIRSAEGVELQVGEGLADDGLVSRFLSACCPLGGARRVAESASDLAPYGLAEPQWTVTLNGGAVTLRVGDYNQPAGGYYAQLEGDPAIYLVPSSVGTSLPESGRDWVRPAD